MVPRYYDVQLLIGRFFFRRFAYVKKRTTISVDKEIEYTQIQEYKER